MDPASPSTPLPTLAEVKATLGFSGSASAKKNARERIRESARAEARHASPETVRQYVLDSLAFKNMLDREQEVTEAHRGTLDWIFDDALATRTVGDDVGSSLSHKQAFQRDFHAWLSSANPGPVYWITGKPGSGKSTLMRFLSQHSRTKILLQEWTGDRPVITASFYFWASGSQEQKSMAGLLRALLHDVLSRHLPLIESAFPELWQTLRAMSTKELISHQLEFTFDELKTAFRCFVDSALSSSNLCLWIDGLDELDGDHQAIINFLRDLTEGSAGDHMKLCVSSRPWDVFQKAFKDSVPSTSLQDLTHQDLYEYTSAKLLENVHLKELVKKDAMELHIFILETVQRADGVFLWVRLAIEHMLKKVTADYRVYDLFEQLDKLPGHLEDLFHTLLLLDRSPEQQESTAKVLQLIQAREVVADFIGDESARALTVWEMAFALVPSHEGKRWILGKEKKNVDGKESESEEGEEESERDVDEASEIDEAEGYFDEDELERRTMEEFRRSKVLEEFDGMPKEGSYEKVEEANDLLIHTLCKRVTRNCVDGFAGLLAMHHHEQARNPQYQPRPRWARLEFGRTTSVMKEMEAARSLTDARIKYVHRTVRDWFMEAESVRQWMADVEDRLTTFDAHLRLLRSYVSRLKHPLEDTEPHRRFNDFWPDLALAMTHARFIVKDPQGLGPRFVQEIDNVIANHYWETRGKDDDWARSAFGSYKVRMMAPLILDPFPCLATRFGLAKFIEWELGQFYYRAIDPSDPRVPTPLLAYATEYLCSRDKTIFPLSNPGIVRRLLEEDVGVKVVLADCSDADRTVCTIMGPNDEYTDFNTLKVTTPWKTVLQSLRTADRRGWIDRQDHEGAKRWISIIKLFLEFDADTEAVLEKDAWDPEISARGVIQMLEDKYGFPELQEIGAWMDGKLRSESDTGDVGDGEEA